MLVPALSQARTPKHTKPNDSPITMNSPRRRRVDPPLPRRAARLVRARRTAHQAALTPPIGPRPHAVFQPALHPRATTRIGSASSQRSIPRPSLGHQRRGHPKAAPRSWNPLHPLHQQAGPFTPLHDAAVPPSTSITTGPSHYGARLVSKAGALR